MREVLGESLRARRIVQGRTLRDVSHDARISLGYLSEIERGQKEASSELLAAIVGALDIPLAVVLADVVERMAAHDRAAEWAALAPVAA
jgi:transcriptional regulator with XRE-family HTH domain